MSASSDFAADAGRRYAICRQCDRLRRGIKQCKECGCFVLLKVRVPSQSCPLGKW